MSHGTLGYVEIGHGDHVLDAGESIAHELKQAVRDAARPPLVIDEDDGDFGIDQRLLTALDCLA